MPWMDYVGGSNSKGVTPVGKQDVSHVAEESLRERSGDDIWKPYESPEVDRVRNRIDEIRTAIGRLYDEKWGPPKPMTQESRMSTPRTKRRLEIEEEIAELEREESGLQAQLRAILDSLPESHKTGKPFTGQEDAEK